MEKTFPNRGGGGGGGVESSSERRETVPVAFVSWNRVADRV